MSRRSPMAKRPYISPSTDLLESEELLQFFYDQRSLPGSPLSEDLTDFLYQWAEDLEII